MLEKSTVCAIKNGVFFPDDSLI